MILIVQVVLVLSFMRKQLIMLLKTTNILISSNSNLKMIYDSMPNILAIMIN